MQHPPPILFHSTDQPTLEVEVELRREVTCSIRAEIDHASARPLVGYQIEARSYMNIGWPLPLVWPFSPHHVRQTRTDRALAVERR